MQSVSNHDEDEAAPPLPAPSGSLKPMKDVYTRIMVTKLEYTFASLAGRSVNDKRHRLRFLRYLHPSILADIKGQFEASRMRSAPNAGSAAPEGDAHAAARASLDSPAARPPDSDSCGAATSSGCSDVAPPDRACSGSDCEPGSSASLEAQQSANPLREADGDCNGLVAVPSSDSALRAPRAHAVHRVRSGAVGKPGGHAGRTAVVERRDAGDRATARRTAIAQAKERLDKLLLTIHAQLAAGDGAAPSAALHAPALSALPGVRGAAGESYADLAKGLVRTIVSALQVASVVDASQREHLVQTIASVKRALAELAGA